MEVWSGAERRGTEVRYPRAWLGSAGQDPMSAKGTHSLLLTSAQRADGVGSEDGLLGVPASMQKGLCAWFRHVLRSWEIAPFGEPGKAHPIPLASVQSTQATCSWLIPFPQFPNLEVYKRVAWRAGRNHLILAKHLPQVFLPTNRR